jgi:ACS family tartrate transporter-like MFS transporter
MSSGTDQVHPHNDQTAIQTRVMRKVAMRLIPFLAMAYFLNYLDRTNISFAKLTMSADLGLTETMYGLASGLFFIGYVFLEVPSNLALHRFGARRWIARIMVSWGLVAVAMAFVNTPTTLYIARILLGIAEAGFFPGIVLYLTFWFPRAVRVRLIGMFMVALPVSSALGAPVSGAIIQYADGVFGLAGWQVMFLLQGIPTVLLGVAAWFYLTDRPQHAKWLTAPERDWLGATIDAEHQTASDAGHVSVARTLRDPRVWALGVVYFGIAYGLFALSFFLPTIVGGLAKTFNTKFSILETGLIVAVPFACGAIAMVFWSRHSDRTGERVWHVALPALLAAVSIPLALYTNSPFATMAVISVTAIGIFCALPVFWYLPSTFLAGAGAAAGIALVNTLGAASGLVAPYMTGWLLDATGDSRTAMWLVGGLELVAAIAVLLLRTSLRAADTHRGTAANATPRASRAS